MTNQIFVNQKLEFVEEIILHTDAHVFLTGKAGTGKTTFLRSLPMKTAKRMVVVAPTGVAAINAGGQTIHSFFQLPFGPQIPEDARQTVEQADPRSQALSMQFHKIRKPKLDLMRALDLGRTVDSLPPEVVFTEREIEVLQAQAERKASES